MIPVSDQLTERITELLQKLIRNACVNDGSPDSGHEMRSVEVLKAFFSEYGIESRVFESRKGRGNLLVRIPGTDPGAPSLMYMGHLDVVPANEDDWEHPPFCGDLIDGEIWGRGAVDMLNMTVTQAVAVAELYKNHGPLPGDLLFLALADEESDGTHGAQYMVEHHWDKVKCDFMVTELGGFFLPVEGQKSRVTVAVGEKGVARAVIKAKGRAAHGSMPYRADNALVTLARCVQALDRNSPSPTFSESYRLMAKGFASSEEQLDRLLNPDTLDQEIAVIAEKDPGSARFIHAASRTTISPNIFYAGSKVNIIPDQGVLWLDIRIAQDITAEQLQQDLCERLGEAGRNVDVSVPEFLSSYSSSADTPLYKAICEEVNFHYPQTTMAPLYISGVSDGRFWRQKGVQVYGITLFAPEMDLTRYSSLLHGKNERISVDSLKKSFEFYAGLPFRLHGAG